MNMKNIKYITYNDVLKYSNYDGRFNILKNNLHGSVGEETFGSMRYLNQILYKSPEWRKARRLVIIRDNGCDLACDNYPIVGNIYVHHINQITPDDILYGSSKIFDINNLICVSLETHNALHYGKNNSNRESFIVREKYDTCPWRK